MSCKHPLKGFIIGTNPSTGNNKLKVTSYNTDHLELRTDGKYYQITDTSVSPFAKVYRDFVDIPCGRCIGCRLSRSKQWADRAVLELQYNAFNYFLTLTYDDDHVPSNNFICPDTGEIGESLTLNKKDLQNFWKRLRKYFPDLKFKYIGVGEYGGNTLRPHYHAIVFGNSCIPDLKFYKFSSTNQMIFESKILDSIWKNGKTYVEEASWEAIAYVCRYVTKKLYGEAASYYETFNLVPEFLTCSLKPAIGKVYYDDHKDELFKNTKYFFPSSNGVRSAVPSRYFNKLFENDFDPVDVEYRKNALKSQFEASKQLKLQNTTLNYLDYLETEEYNLEKRTKKLVRSEI